MSEAVQPISMADYALTLHIVQNRANLFRRIFVVVQNRYETSDGAFEIDVVFPQRVIGVNEQGLRAVQFCRQCHPETLYMYSVNWQDEEKIDSEIALLES